MKPAFLVLCFIGTALHGQEADSGFELRTTLSGAAAYSPQLANQPRFGAPAAAGFRSMLYPTWKLNRNWTVSGAIQVHSRPFFAEEFTTQGYGVKADVLQAHLSYSQFWRRGSVVVRLGQLSSAFGSFLLHYDDSSNPLISMPPAYGYYYKPVSTLALTGAQVDATLGSLDARAQFTTASPANRRGVFDREQYGSWTGGVGYTIRQVLRVGVSAYRGPYLHRQYRYYFPGEADPRSLPASGYGLDAQWGRGAWTVSAEWQRFQMAYRRIRTFNEHTGYAEARRVLHPRLYLAARAGYLRTSAYQGPELYEAVAGFRPGRSQLVKIGYQLQHGPVTNGRSAGAVLFQFVTTFRPISIARD